MLIFGYVFGFCHKLCWTLVRVLEDLGEIFSGVQAIVQLIFLDSGPRHLLAGETSSPVSLWVHGHDPSQPTDSGLHMGQTQIAGTFSWLAWAETENRSCCKTDTYSQRLCSVLLINEHFGLIQLRQEKKICTSIVVLQFTSMQSELSHLVQSSLLFVSVQQQGFFFGITHLLLRRSECYCVFTADSPIFSLEIDYWFRFKTYGTILIRT